MKLPQHTGRRGQPLAALAILLIAWVGVRTAVWANSTGYVIAPIAAQAKAPVPPAADLTPAPAPAPTLAAPIAPEPTAKDKAEPRPEPTTIAPVPDATPTTTAPAAVPPQVAAGHQYLFMAGMAAMPMPEDTVAAAAPIAQIRPPVPYLPTAGTEAQRWSGDGWLLWRQGGVGYNLPGAGLPGASLTSGAYGASQAGLVLRYRLAPTSKHRPTLYLRASSGLNYPRGEELAAGFAFRPLGKLPVAVMGEGRITRTTTGTIVRPAVAVVTELPPAKLPLGFRGEAYGQAGWVGGKDDTPFIDGQARIEKPVVRAGSLELRVGGGAWGGAQKGASRLDIGPSATLELPLGPVGSRLSADYRFRVSGNAAPGSGAAITLSAGF